LPANVLVNSTQSNIAQIPALSARTLPGIDTPSQSVRISIGTHAGVRNLARNMSGKKGKVMQMPSMLQGESLTRLMQGAAVGAVAAIAIGFFWGGWSLASTADRMAKDRSELAVVAALAPVCADKFRALPDSDARKTALSKVDSWKRRDEFPKELVTLPGESFPNTTLVDACYKLLVAPKSAELK
jgi:hypothetical protein